MEYKTPVVIDSGSMTTRAGLAGDNLPRVIFPSVVGLSKDYQGYVPLGSGAKETYIGEEVKNKRDTLTIKYPIQYGIVNDWHNMEYIWRDIFTNKLHVNPEEHPVLLAEPPLNPKYCREKTTQIMFETFNTPAMYMANHASLSLIACDRETGIVVVSGSDTTYVAPVYEGHILPYSVPKYEVAGRYVTDHLLEILKKSGYDFTTKDELESVREIKERFSYVALNYNEEQERAGTSANLARFYHLPDGSLVKIACERFIAPEIIFQPILAGFELPGLQETILRAISLSDQELCKELLGNIVLSGGNTLFPGLAERLKAEVDSLLKLTKWANVPVAVVVPQDHKEAVWIGGSRLASLPTFQQMWITNAEYDEYGPTMVHRKCF